MDSKPLYRSAAVRPPTEQQLQAAAQHARLQISPEDMKQYTTFMTEFVHVYDRLDQMAEPFPPPTSYPTTPGFHPEPKDNPYNAWIWKTDIVGSGTGKLAGKTVAVKDNIHIVGVPMSCSSRFLRGFVSSYSATVVKRVLDAGGLVKGKATCEDMSSTGNSFTSCTGPVLNPFNKTHSAGGSSSGCAVLVATGEVDMAIGTDTGGSIRIPSCCCGIVGLKPTYGLIPITGVVSIDMNLEHVGPMTRTVYDCALMLEALAGYNGGLDICQSPEMTPVNYTEHLTGDISGLRIGLLQEGFSDCETDVAETVRDAANSLKQLGVTVDEFSFPLHNEALTVGTAICLEGLYETYTHGGICPFNTPGFKDSATHDFWFNASRSNADSLPFSMKFLIMAASYIRENYGCRFYAKAVNIRHRLMAEYDELFQRFDVIIMPTIKFKASKLPPAQSTLEQLLGVCLNTTHNTFPYNVTGNPALSINAGFSETEPRLPIGMMIVGRRSDDLTVLRVAHAFEKLRNSTSYGDLEASLLAKTKSLEI